MIPLRDTIPSRSVPIVNWMLIFTNVLIFIFEVFILNGPQAESFIYTYGLVPDNIRLAGLT